MRAGLRLFGRERDAGNAGNGRHTRRGRLTVSRLTKIEKWEVRTDFGKRGACGLDAGRLTDFERGRTGRARG